MWGRDVGGGRKAELEDDRVIVTHMHLLLRPQIACTSVMWLEVGSGGYFSYRNPFGTAPTWLEHNYLNLACANIFCSVEKGSRVEL